MNQDRFTSESTFFHPYNSFPELPSVNIFLAFACGSMRTENIAQRMGTIEVGQSLLAMRPLKMRIKYFRSIFALKSWVRIDRHPILALSGCRTLKSVMKIMRHWRRVYKGIFDLLRYVDDTYARSTTSPSRPMEDRILCAEKYIRYDLNRTVLIRLVQAKRAFFIVVVANGGSWRS